MNIKNNNLNMSKIVFIKQNSPEIRNKLKKSGFSVCICSTFDDSIWLSYHSYPEDELPFDIHGEGYCDPGDYDEKYSPLDRIKSRLSTPGYYSEDREFFDTVEEFLNKYKKVVSDQPSD